MANESRLVGLFAGVGGFELGFRPAGYRAELLCEWWEPAQLVLARRFPGVPVVGDINLMGSIPKAEVVCAGFPCTDLSQAGRTAGINGDQSGLVRKALALVAATPPKDWLVLENVRNMLPLHRGRAMAVLVDAVEAMGYRWAYRVVDSRCAGVPQRRQRVFFVASRSHDPKGVLFADDAGEPDEATFRGDTHGFYWTEGLRGLGWAADATPTLKGGSTIGIPSPPGVWVRDGMPGHRLVKPSISAAERLQGFPTGWTKPATNSSEARGLGVRWKLVGNSVTVPVVRWLGRRLKNPGESDSAVESKLKGGDPWPLAAWGEAGTRRSVDVSMWPIRYKYTHLGDLLVSKGCEPLSHRGASGFLSRLEKSGLRLFPPEFKVDCKEHVELTAV